MLSEGRVRELLQPFGIELSSCQVGQIIAYLDLLLRWNRKINLTAIRRPEECMTRHFGESLYLARWIELNGQLLDIGSGAGFPGLALKIVFPQLAATLLEPVAKKRAFLNEVARECGMKLVQVRPERLEDFLLQNPGGSVDSATARAVGHLDELVPQAAHCLRFGGRLCLWLTRRQSDSLHLDQALFAWESPIPLPLASEREIWVGTRSNVGASRWPRERTGQVPSGR